MGVALKALYRSVLGILAGSFLILGFLAGPASAEPHIPPAPFPALPATAELDPAIQNDVNTKGYHIAELKDGVYWITDGNYHSMAVLTKKGVMLVDAPEPLPFFPPLNVVAAIAEITDKPITHMIYSHAHTDHIGGAGAVKAAFPNVKIIAHKLTDEVLKAAKDPRRPRPTATFANQRSVQNGGKLLRLFYFGNTHQKGNIFIYAPFQKILMAVDIVYPGWVPFRRLALSEDIRGWLTGHRKLLTFDFDILLGGHLTRLGTKKDVEIAMEYNADIKKFIEEVYFDPNSTLFAAVGAIDAIHGGGAAFTTVAKWALFSAFYDFNSEHCASQLDAKWVGVLGGAETFNFSNCEAYFQALRLGDVKAPTP